MVSARNILLLLLLTSLYLGNISMRIYSYFFRRIGYIIDSSGDSSSPENTGKHGCVLSRHHDQIFCCVEPGSF